MSMDTSKVLEFLELLAEKKELTLCLKQSFKAALLAGAGAGSGGLIFGPVGALVGGIGGSIAAYCTGEEFKPLHQVIRDMPEAERRQLGQHIKKILEELGITDPDVLMGILESGSHTGGKVVSVVVEKLENHFGGSIKTCQTVRR